jgi:hypothetical protein
MPRKQREFDNSGSASFFVRGSRSDARLVAMAFDFIGWWLDDPMLVGLGRWVDFAGGASIRAVAVVLSCVRVHGEDVHPVLGLPVSTRVLGFAPRLSRFG